LELWGGIECTVNRVGDRYRDQTKLTGHHDRPEDLARFAELGISKLRYPVLWERVAPDPAQAPDWRWTDERLAEIRRLGMMPIAGLVHHGSGPRHTSLVDPSFAPLLADYAGEAAQRYPWVEDWTPVNEPLTTARFSALYGVWYPHARDDRSFWAALLNQIDATRLAMRAIRAVNPQARLIQTEDLGRTYATDELAWQAEYNNARRWVTWDLLCGRVGPDHLLWYDLERYGFADRVRAICDDPCPPDVIGVNHYVTSDRLLDHRLDRYDLPAPPLGYHDLTAARVLDPPPAGLSGVLREAWERYRLPLAVTESHLGCTREEQLRWIAQSWRDCVQLADSGVDVRALTAWALLGNVDWAHLLAKEVGHYEPGPFDVRGGEPRPTAVAALPS
jgi:dTDP-4-dehydrorhamnose reductase